MSEILRKEAKGLPRVLRLLAVVALGVQLSSLARPQAPAKSWKDAAEFSLYSKANSDLIASKWADALTDLDAWKQAYPNSDFRDESAALYVSAFFGTGQYDKVVDEAGPLIDRDLAKVFPDPVSGPSVHARVLYCAVVAFMHLKNPTPQELAAGERAARELSAFNRRVSSASDSVWNTARQDLQAQGRKALAWLAAKSGLEAMTRSDYAAAEAVFTRALGDYPESAYLAYNLASALLKEKKSFEAVYEFERASVLDASLGGVAPDPEAIRQYADRTYVTVHGSAEGLDHLKEQVKASALPPPGFKIETAAEIAVRKQQEWERANPQLALWLNVKRALLEPDGEQYFASSVKDAEFPAMRGHIISEAPAARPRDLVLGMSDSTTPEVTLHLDAPLPVPLGAGSEIEFEGFALSFARSPFMLTFDVAPAKIKRLGGGSASAAVVNAPPAPDASTRGVTTPNAVRPSQSATHYVAMVIGNNDYRYLPRLATAVNDAQEVDRALRTECGFTTDLMLNASREQILNALNRRRRELPPDSAFLIYYAGHGQFDKDTQKAYWLPVDARADENTQWISADDITGNIRALPARQVLVVSDSCYSGALSRSAPEPSLAPVGDRERFLENLRARGPARILLSSGGNEPVADSAGGAHSIFAAALLRGLHSMANPSFTVDELFGAYIYESVAGRSGQVPECTPLRNSGHDSGTFIFERRAAGQ